MPDFRMHSGAEAFSMKVVGVNGTKVGSIPKVSLGGPSLRKHLFAAIVGLTFPDRPLRTLPLQTHPIGHSELERGADVHRPSVLAGIAT